MPPRLLPSKKTAGAVFAYGAAVGLQMQYAVFDLLGTALIPELGADVAAGPSGDAHFVLVAIAAVRAFPDELAVFVFDDLDLSIIAADHAVVADRKSVV